MGQDVEQPQDIYSEAVEEGYERLERTRSDLIVTSAIAGGEILFGAIVALTVTAALLPVFGGGETGRDAASVLGALTFPIGFVLVLLGRRELFTENFLIPITAVIRSPDTRVALRRLARLWSLSLVFNLIGALLAAFLLTRSGVLPGASLEEVRHLGEYKIERSFSEAFFSAVQAGVLMTLLTWLLLSVHEFGAKIAVIFSVAFVIELHHFNHVVVSAGQIFMAIFAGAEIGFLDWLRANFVPAVLGNVVGGVGLVTGLRALQVWTKQKHEPVVH